MGIRTTFNPIDGKKMPYKRGEVLFDGNNGETGNVKLYKGFYYIRGQGSGGSGGNNNYWANGGGGGSGAGFEGYVYVSTDLKNPIAVYAGKAANTSAAAGEDSYIENLLILGGGQGGTSGTGGKGGLLTFVNEKVLSAAKEIIAKNGYDGSSAGSNSVPGANSVLSDDGGGPAGGKGSEGKTATKPGAGGAGGTQWDSLGGLGKFGEILIRYEGRKLPVIS